MALISSALPDTSWMTPQERWCWERILSGAEADLAELPADIRDKINQGSSMPVDAATERANTGRLTPIDDARWLASQTISARFIELMCCGPAFVAARARNEVRIASARIKEVVNISNEDCSGSIYLHRCRFDNGVLARGTHIKGVLSLNGTHVERVFDAQRLRIVGSIFFRAGCIINCRVRLFNARISGNIRCEDSLIRSDQFAQSLALDLAQIDGSLFIRNGAEFFGEVNLVGARLGGNISCAGATIHAGASGRAVFGDAVKIGGSCFFRDRFVADGDISLIRANVGGSVQFWGSDLGGKVDLSGAEVGGELILSDPESGRNAPNYSANSAIKLRNLTVSTLQSDIDAFRTTNRYVPMHLSGMNVGRISGTHLERAPSSEVIKWLEAGTEATESRCGFSQSPYVTIANAFEGAGEIDTARDIRIALETRKTCEMSWRWPRKWFRLLLHRITGYGYLPYRGLVWIIGFWIMYALIGYTAANWGQSLSPLKLGAWIDLLRWFGFSLEQIIPFVDLDPVKDNFLQEEFGATTNEYGYADKNVVPFGMRALFMSERLVGLVILGVSLAGITAWAERRS